MAGSTKGRYQRSGTGMTMDLAPRYKQAVSIPCGVVTFMDPVHAPDFFEQALEDGKAIITTETGLDMEIPCDAIVNAADMLTNTSLADGITCEVYAIGDCAAPYNIAKAIHAGNDAGRAV